MQRLKHQAGFALMEALVATLVLSAGVLALLWLQQNALRLQRQQLLRATAADLADDLAQRMQLNAAQRNLYARTWGASNSTSNNTTIATADCAAQPCTQIELAQWDMQQFQAALQTQLPEGDAAVFALSQPAEWWGIVLAWRDPTQSYRTDTRAGTPPCPAQMSCWRLFFRPSL